MISLSRFDYAKNSVEVLKLAQQFPDVKFWIIGDGPDRNLLLQKKKRLGLQNLWLPGFREDITEILSVQTCIFRHQDGKACLSQCLKQCRSVFRRWLLMLMDKGILSNTGLVVFCTSPETSKKPENT